MERVGLSYVRTFPTSMTAPVEGVEEGEVEYEMTREQWERSTTERLEIGTRTDRLPAREKRAIPWKGTDPMQSELSLHEPEG
jgi:hypothetical protein